MATLKTRLEALEAKTPSASGNYCMVVHGKGDCAKARQDAIAEYMALYGCEPVNFFDIMLVSAGGNRGTCQCKQVANDTFAVTGPDSRNIMADLVKEADGSALPVVKIA